VDFLGIGARPEIPLSREIDDVDEQVARPVRQLPGETLDRVGGDFGLDLELAAVTLRRGRRGGSPSCVHHRAVLDDLEGSDVLGSPSRTPMM
jgi:hypothetical protein